MGPKIVAWKTPRTEFDMLLIVFMSPIAEVISYIHTNLVIHNVKGLRLTETVVSF